MKNDIEVYDIEVFPNFFSYTGFNIINKTYYKFYIYDNNDFKDKINELKNYILSLKGMIGFNNINYDYIIIHDLLNDKFKCNLDIYNKSQEIINNQNRDIKITIPEWKHLVKQLDLFKIHHFDNKAKRTSLKDVQIAIQWKKVQDFPYSFDHFVLEEQIEEILDYNTNDVLSTYEFYLKSLDQIKLRKELSKEFNMNMLNYNEPKLGSEIFLDMIHKESKINKKELRELRTKRDKIIVKNILLPYIKFKTKEFNKVLEHFQNKIITDTKSKNNFSFIHNEIKYDYGQGGIHACINSGIYKSDNDNVIYDIDVASFYPNLAINNGFKPEHLGSIFNNIYKFIYDRRKEIPKTDIRNGAYKLCLNGVFGKSNEETSYLYDPQFTMQITINGQLLISMLAEEFSLLNYTILQCNTDGITIKFPRKEKDKVDIICKNFENLTNLTLEYQEYKTMAIRDVNNYMAVDINNKPKYKGCFEIIKMQNGQVAYNKDWSFRIVPIAISEYIINNKPIEETIKNHKNILDFCGRFKASYGWYSEIRYINNYKEVREKQQKTNRYYISNKGDVYYKVHSDGREEAIEKNYLVKIYNNNDKNINNFNDYYINYNYYIRECNKIIDIIEPKQMTIFDVLGS
jgi:hypothetical protein